MEPRGRNPPAALLRLRHSLVRVPLEEVARSVNAVLGVLSYPAHPIVAHCFEQEALSRDRRLAKVAAHLFDNVDETANLAAVASVAGVERHCFSSYFRRGTGVAFSRWRTVVRCSCGAWLLARTDATVTAAAMATGYGNMTTFCRAFRREFGVNPSTFVALCRAREIQLVPVIAGAPSNGKAPGDR